MKLFSQLLTVGALALFMCQAFAAPTHKIPGLLDLEGAQRIAIAGNPGLLAAQARVDQAATRVKQARAGYYPRVDAGMSASRTWLSDNSLDEARAQADLIASLLGNKATGVSRNMDHFGVGLSASWIIFDGFGREFGLAAARFGREESAAAYEEAKRLLLSAVARSFFSVQLARENINIAEADEKFNLRQLEDARKRRQRGKGSLSDELNFEIRTNFAESSSITANRNYQLALIGLATLMGLPGADALKSTTIAALEQETQRELEQPELGRALDFAVENRPDMLRAEYGAKRADATVGSRRSVFYPSIVASASEDSISSNRIDLDTDNLSTSVGVAISFNIFAGGRHKAALGEAKAVSREAGRITRDTELRIMSEVQSAFETLKAAQEDIQLQRSTTKNAQRNRDLVEKEYDAGQASLIRQNEAQRDLIQAQSRLALARVLLRQAWHDMHTATAETLSKFQK